MKKKRPPKTARGVRETKTVVMAWGASVVHVPEFGYVSVVHHSTENPVDVMQRYVDGETVPVAGPFGTMEEAKTHGSATLSASLVVLKKSGFKAYRPNEN